MSDDAQAQPGSPQNAAPGPWASPGDDTAPAPAEVSLDKPAAAPRPAPDPWAPPAGQAPGAGTATPGGPVSAGPPDTAALGGAPSVHDQHTVVSLPGSEAPAGPWSAPFAPPGPAPSTPGGPAVGALPPFGGPTPGALADPFAPPAAGEPVPPPPIGPEGPGQPPYAYPAHPGYPGYGPGGGAVGYGWPGTPFMPSNGLGTASMVLGIVSAAVFCLWPVAIVVGVLAVIFGIIGRRKARRGEATNGGMALAGLICGAVGVALGIGLFAVILTAPNNNDDPWFAPEDGYSMSLTAHRLG
ncbi:DUF4190 domain-containing protein [Streptomyces sp. NPDC007264]|uniref:DUF4190 domain-containing protein n=1 Tax=Streptomyces sp. NPDC007264 TaxID=3364777 RepID=UPI0036DF08A0